MVLEFFDVDGSGRAVQALVEPEMVRVWRDYSWTEHPVEGLVGSRRGRQPDGFTDPESMYGAARRPQGLGEQQGEYDDEEEDEDEVVQLHVLTAERIHVGGELPDFVDVLCADGCPGGRARLAAGPADRKQGLRRALRTAWPGLGHVNCCHSPHWCRCPVPVPSCHWPHPWPQPTAWWTI